MEFIKFRRLLGLRFRHKGRNRVGQRKGMTEERAYLPQVLLGSCGMIVVGYQY